MPNAHSPCPSLLGLCLPFSLACICSPGIQGNAIAAIPLPLPHMAASLLCSFGAIVIQAGEGGGVDLDIVQM
jgi:hypothetical protein